MPYRDEDYSSSDAEADGFGRKWLELYCQCGHRWQDHDDGACIDCQCDEFREVEG